MGNLRLSIALQRNRQTQGILDGDVQPEGIDLVPSSIHSGEIIWRQVRFAEFDIAQMSLPTLLILAAKGDSPWYGIPVFPYRAFFHTWFQVHVESGIREPIDLHGKRVAVSEYMMTAAVWTRGILGDEFGVDPAKIEWFEERSEKRSIGRAIGFKPPSGVRIQHIPKGETTISMLTKGKVDAAAVHIPESTLLDRSGIALEGQANMTLLFQDPITECIRYYQKTRIYPINHCVAVRRSILERHSWVALNLYRAFLEASEKVAQRDREALDLYINLGLIPLESRASLLDNPFMHGIEVNRGALEAILRYAVEQGLTPSLVSLDELFAANTLDL